MVSVRNKTKVNEGNYRQEETTAVNNIAIMISHVIIKNLSRILGSKVFYGVLSKSCDSFGVCS